MLLPYPLDLLPSAIGRVLARLSGWQPVGKRVRLAFTEGDLIGTETTGTVQRAISEILTAGPDGSTRHDDISLLIRLDRQLADASGPVSWIVVLPRFYGHGPHRLLVTWSAVDVYVSRAGPEPPTVLRQEDMIAICLMKLDRRVG